MIELGKQYATRNGRPVRLLCVDGPDPHYPVIGIPEGDYEGERWTAEGAILYNIPGDDERDLVEVTA